MGLRTGFTDIDSKTQGLQASDFIVLVSATVGW